MAFVDQERLLPGGKIVTKIACQHDGSFSVDSARIIHREFVPEGTTVNSHASQNYGDAF
jgi:hypothetical protein